jgi:hypothetical protein
MSRSCLFWPNEKDFLWCAADANNPVELNRWVVPGNLSWKLGAQVGTMALFMVSNKRKSEHPEIPRQSPAHVIRVHAYRQSNIPIEFCGMARDAETIGATECLLVIFFQRFGIGMAV